MRLDDKDFEIIVAFLVREAHEFRAINEDVSKSTDYVTNIIDQMNAALLPIDGADYVHIISLSNMGLMYRTLVLTPVEWKSGRIVYITLPPAPPPRGRISVRIQKGTAL